MREPSEAEKSGIPIWRSVVVLVLVGITVAACLFLTPTPEKSEAGIALELPEQVGFFEGKEAPISEGERVILPEDTEFAKKIYSDGTGNQIQAQIVLAGAEKRSIHRPEVCLPGQGWALDSGETIPVKLSDGRTIDVMKLRISRTVQLPNGQPKKLTSLFLYWFVGKDTTTASHFVRILKTNMDMLLHNTNHRWAYVIATSPVMEGFAPNGKNEEETLQMLKDFVSEAAPTFMQDQGKPSA